MDGVQYDIFCTYNNHDHKDIVKPHTFCIFYKLIPGHKWEACGSQKNNSNWEQYCGVCSGSCTEHYMPKETVAELGTHQ